MKLDKKTLSLLTALPDESLWKIICSIAASNGLDLSAIHPDRQSLAKLRGALSGLDDSDIQRAAEILRTAGLKKD